MQSINVCLRKILDSVSWVFQVIYFKIGIDGKKWYTLVMYSLREYIRFIREGSVKNTLTSLMKIKC